MQTNREVPALIEGILFPPQLYQSMSWPSFIHHSTQNWMVIQNQLTRLPQHTWEERYSRKKIKNWSNRSAAWRNISTIGQKKVLSGGALYAIRCRIKSWIRINVVEVCGKVVDWNWIIYWKRKKQKLLLQYDLLSNHNRRSLIAWFLPNIQQILMNITFIQKQHQMKDFLSCEVVPGSSVSRFWISIQLYVECYISDDTGIPCYGPWLV